ncbi:MAG: hypothetical protein HZB91_15030, partial [Elusimicrobia bacterium]|nr:hypothetical protein [Elusimicrobiota bacterium]
MPVQKTLPILILSLVMTACSGVSFNIPRPEPDPARAGPAFAGETRPGPGAMPQASIVPPTQTPAAAEAKTQEPPVKKAGAPNTKEDLAIQAALAKVRSGKAGYKVRPGDLIEISIFQEKDLDRKLRVGP